jgi:hypothetical protein
VSKKSVLLDFLGGKYEGSKPSPKHRYLEMDKKSYCYEIFKSRKRIVARRKRRKKEEKKKGRVEGNNGEREDYREVEEGMKETKDKDARERKNQKEKHNERRTERKEREGKCLKNGRQQSEKHMRFTAH